MLIIACKTQVNESNFMEQKKSEIRFGYFVEGIIRVLSERRTTESYRTCVGYMCIATAQFRLVARCRTYETPCGWCTRQDLNLQPTDQKSARQAYHRLLLIAINYYYLQYYQSIILSLSNVDYYLILRPIDTYMDTYYRMMDTYMDTYI